MFGRAAAHGSGKQNGSATNGDAPAACNRSNGAAGAANGNGLAAARTNGQTIGQPTNRQPTNVQSSNGQSAASGPASAGGGAAGRQDEPSVRFFLMGCRCGRALDICMSKQSCLSYVCTCLLKHWRQLALHCDRPHWKSAHSWPPEDLAEQQLVLHLGGNGSSRDTNGNTGSGFAVTPLAPSSGAGDGAAAAPAVAPANGGSAAAADRSQGGQAPQAAQSPTAGGGGGAQEVPLRRHGCLSAAAAAPPLRWRQEVDRSLYLKVPLNK